MPKKPHTASATSFGDDAAAEWVSPAKLTPWAKNPKPVLPEDVREMGRSIRRFGFGAPIVARRANDEVIEGHLRLEAALRLRLDRVPVRYLELSEDEAHLLAIAAIKFEHRRETVADELAAILDDLEEKGVDLTVGTGYEDEEIDAILDAAAESGDQPRRGGAEALSTEGDDAIELANGRADSKLGIIYELGPHRLFCGDSREMSELGKGARLQVADPPFDVPYGQWRVLEGVDVVAVWFRSKDALAWVLAEMGGDDWGMHMFAFTGGVRGQHNHTLPCCMHENVMVLRRTWWKDKLEAIDRDVLRASGCKSTKDPDTRPISWQEKSGGVVAAQEIGMTWAKPIMQFEILVAYVPRGSIVWDPCAGSGSSLIASARHGRVWRGCENEPRHADLIRRRWTKMAIQNGLEPGTGLLD